MKLDRAIEPRRWQKSALNSWSHSESGVVRVVTGGGKTVFSYMCMERFFLEHPDGLAIIVVPTIALLDQWFVDICDATDLDESDVACFSGRARPDKPSKVNIVVLNTARRITAELSESGPTMLVVDECHRAGAQENSHALEGRFEATLGLSATPERESDDGFETHIAPALGKIIYSYDYGEAKGDGVIVDFNLINVEIALNGDDVDRLPALSGMKDGLVKSDSDGAGFDRLSEAASEKVSRSAEYALRVPWAVKLALNHREERVIIFHERVASLKRINDLLAQFGQNSVSYHSHLSESHRRDNLRLFRRGIVNMLATCRALDEGANVPEANVAIVARSTSSTRQRIQRLGRVLRPAQGKDNAIVYTLFTGTEQQERLAEEASELEGVANVLWMRGTVK